MDITIFPDKKRFPMMLFFWIVIFFFLVWSFANPRINAFPANTVGHSIFKTILLGIVLFYTVRAAVNYLYAITNPNSRLTINDSGIDDKLTIYSIGQVKWTDVDSVSSGKFLNIDLLLLNLKDPKNIIAQQKNWKRRYLNKLLKKWGTPMIISQRVIDYDIKELRIQIQERLNR